MYNTRGCKYLWSVIDSHSGDVEYTPVSYALVDFTNLFLCMGGQDMAKTTTKLTCLGTVHMQRLSTGALDVPCTVQHDSRNAVHSRADIAKQIFRF